MDRVQNKSKVASYSLVLVFGAILFANSFAISMPQAFAQENDDSKAVRLGELKNLVGNNHREDQCEDNKYGDICDRQKPRISITEPRNGARLPEGDVTIAGTADDRLSGIQKVEVKLNREPFEQAAFSNGNWEITKNLDRGLYVIIAKATDNANNIKLSFGYFIVQ